MTRSPPAARLAAFTAAALAVGACGGEAENAGENGGDGAEPRGSYDIDAETGETRARHTGDDGTVTTMRSGERVPVVGLESGHRGGDPERRVCGHMTLQGCHVAGSWPATRRHETLAWALAGMIALRPSPVAPLHMPSISRVGRAQARSRGVNSGSPNRLEAPVSFR